MVGILLECCQSGDVIHGSGWVTEGLLGVTTMLPAIDADAPAGSVEGLPGGDIVTIDEWRLRSVTLRPQAGVWPEVSAMPTSRPPTDEELHAEMAGWGLT